MTADKKPRILRQMLYACSLIGIGCVLNNLILEVIVSKKANDWADKGAGGAMTLLQFVFIVCCTLPSRIASVGTTPEKDDDKWLVKLGPLAIRPTRIPLKHYAFQTILFFGMSYLNNAAFYFNISQPLHMVFRSANLVTTYILGRLFFGKKYTSTQLICVIMLTLGAAAATFAEALTFPGVPAAACANCGAGGGSGLIATPANASSYAGAVPTFAPGTLTGAAGSGVGAEGGVDRLWLIGVAVLCSVLILQTCLSNYQNVMTATYGSAPEEAMFFTHLFSLAPFLLTLPDVVYRFGLWSQSPPTHSVVETNYPVGESTAMHFLLGALLRPFWYLPIMWTYIIINVVTQYCCVVGVYNLIPVSDPLTINVVLTVRKFLSLIVSIYTFNNAFTVVHWLGALLVLGGIIVYGIVSQPAPPPPAASIPGASAILGTGAGAGLHPGKGGAAYLSSGPVVATASTSGSGTVEGTESSPTALSSVRLEEGASRYHPSNALDGGMITATTTHRRGQVGAVGTSSSTHVLAANGKGAYRPHATSHHKDVKLM